MSPCYKNLLAKKPEYSFNCKYEETLLGHTDRVCQAAEIISKSIVPNLIKTGLLSDSEKDVWSNAIWIASWLHDWGKANDHFQKMMRASNFNQGVRHELLSLFLFNEFSSWLEPLWQKMPSWLKPAVIFSITGHHLKFPDPYEDKRQGLYVEVFTNHQDFTILLEMGKKRFNLCNPPLIPQKKLSLKRSGEIIKTLKRIKRESDSDFTDSEKLLIASVKATVMAADLAGSALTEDDHNLTTWIKDRLNKTLSSTELLKLIEKKLSGKTLHKFQKAVTNSNKDFILIEAGCGSGKTIAAYLWASRNADNKRVFFCYPTTGTASEGFSGYMFDNEFDATLIHSRAKVDYRLLKTMPARNHEENELREAGLEALETWPIPMVVCTAHTVLGILENVRRGIYAWPSMAQSVFIFDEIHSFSNRLFSYLLRFLKSFPSSKVLLMTATLPPERKKAIEDVCYIRGGIDIFKGPATRENAMRYYLNKSETEKAWEKVLNCLNSGGKVLWISNTISKAMKVLDEALKLKLPAQPYHSRYRYKDRLERQRAVIDGFAPKMPSILAITTQVAEMSLDISADLLVCEIAPISAMIQRLGRLNRFEEIPDKPLPAIFIIPDKRLPYSQDDELWRRIDLWLECLCDGKPKSQREIMELFIELEKEEKDTIDPTIRCEWLDGLWMSLKGKRSIEEAGYTIEVVRKQDMETGSLVENAIPMPFPRNKSWQSWDRKGRFVIAPVGTINYDCFRGAKWEEN